MVVYVDGFRSLAYGYADVPSGDTASILRALGLAFEVMDYWGEDDPPERLSDLAGKEVDGPVLDEAIAASRALVGMEV